MRGRLAKVSDRVIGIALGILLGLLIIVLFLFLGSRSTIDEPSISDGTTETLTQPATSTGASAPKPPQ
jgi:uncharacterized membrane protein required for colicin V production